MKTKSFGRLVATLSGGMAASCFLNGCSALQTPQQACVAPETTNAIVGLLAQGAVGQAPAISQLFGTAIDFTQVPDVVQGLWKRKLISIEHITLKSFDKDTKVVRCAGVLTMGGSKAQIEYERQPEASGSNYVYRLDSAGDYQTAMLLMVASNQKPAALSPPPQSSAPNVASADPTSNETSENETSESSQPAPGAKVVQISVDGPTEFTAPAVQVHCSFEIGAHTTGLECSGPGYDVDCDGWVVCKASKTSGGGTVAADQSNPTAIVASAGMRFTMNGSPECTVRAAEVACSMSGIDAGPGKTTTGFVATADGVRLFTGK